MDGIVAPWEGKIGVAKRGRLTAEKELTKRWVGIPGMDAIAAHLSADVDTRLNIEVVSLQKNDDKWHLIDNQQHTHGPYDAIIVAAPPPQTIGLVEPSPALLDRISGIEMRPCLTVMAAFDEPLDVPFDAVFIHESPIRWAAKNNSKPQRGAAECWTLHANAQWSDANADTDDEQRLTALIEAFFKSVACRRIDPIYQHTRYWQSAAAANPLSVGCLWDPHLKIGMCGDWCQMSRLEGAALSGMAMAGRNLYMVQVTSPHRSESCGLAAKASKACFSFPNTVASP